MKQLRIITMLSAIWLTSICSAKTSKIDIKPAHAPVNLSSLPTAELLDHLSKTFNIQQPSDCVAGKNKEGTIPVGHNTDSHQGACTALDFKSMVWSYGFSTIQEVKRAFNQYTDDRIKELLKRPDSPIKCVLLINLREKQFHYYIYKKTDGIKNVLLHALGQQVVPEPLEPFVSGTLLGGYTPESTIYYLLLPQFRNIHALIPHIYKTNYYQWPPEIQAAYDQFEQSKAPYFKTLQEQAQQWITKNRERTIEDLMAELRSLEIIVMDFPL